MAKIKKKAGRTILSPQEEIQNITHNVSGLYETYRQQVNVAVTLLVLVVLVGVVYSFVRSNNEKKAGQLLSAAYEAYSPGAAAPANYPLALQRFQEVVKQYGGTVSGMIAQFSIGNTYAQMGQPEPALKEYDAFLKEHGGNRFLAGLVHQRRGYAYLALGRQEEAKKAFAQAESLIGTGAATLELARLYDRSGNIAEAQKLYKEINDKIPGTAWAQEARAKLPPPELKLPLSQPAGTK
jgi:tetratricopeptide (TPR) repeat protein